LIYKSRTMYYCLWR